jgi:DNA-binding MarR family transcriptional regulator
VLADIGLIDAEAHVTVAGTAVLDRLRTAREFRIQTLLSDWAPERHPEVLEIIRQLTNSLAEAPPEPRPSS